VIGADVDGGQFVLETGRSYDGIEPVLVHVTKRDGRLEFSDRGGAVAAAGAHPGQLDFDDHIVMGEYSVNVSRKGVVFLQGFTSQGEEWIARLAELVAEGSLLFYEALLEAED
jgi:hypothetical protein